MSVIPAFLFLILGLLILVVSANWLIQTSVKFSLFLRVAPLFIGMVLLAFGTSTPEAAVGIVAAVKNHKGIALGNILGSNISNIGLILGLCAFLNPMKVRKDLLKKEALLMVFSAVLLFLLCLDLSLSRADGVILLVVFFFFCLFSLKNARNTSGEDDETKDIRIRRWINRIRSPLSLVGVIILCISGVVIGADIMVKAGVNIASFFGIKPWVVGITVFAIGTSLPELATSLTASFKRIPSMSVGNIIGSNIFNILFVLGVVALIRPIAISADNFRFEFPALLAFTFILFTVMRTGYKINRFEGLFMFCAYLAFLVLIFIR